MDNDEQNNNNGITGYAKYTGIAFQMIAIIGGFTYAGYKIDQSANHGTKWVTAVLALTGVCISMYVVIKSINK